MSPRSPEVRPARRSLPRSLPRRLPRHLAARRCLAPVLAPLLATALAFGLAACDGAGSDEGGSDRGQGGPAPADLLAGAPTTTTPDGWWTEEDDGDLSLDLDAAAPPSDDPAAWRVPPDVPDPLAVLADGSVVVDVTTVTTDPFAAPPSATLAHLPASADLATAPRPIEVPRPAGTWTADEVHALGTRITWVERTPDAAAETTPWRVYAWDAAEGGPATLVATDWTEADDLQLEPRLGPDARVYLTVADDDGPDVWSVAATGSDEPRLEVPGAYAASPGADHLTAIRQVAGPDGPTDEVVARPLGEPDAPLETLVTTPTTVLRAQLTDDGRVVWEGASTDPEQLTSAVFVTADDVTSTLAAAGDGGSVSLDRASDSRTVRLRVAVAYDAPPRTVLAFTPEDGGLVDVGYPSLAGTAVAEGAAYWRDASSARWTSAAR